MGKLSPKTTSIAIFVIATVLFFSILYYTSNTIAINEQLHKGCNLPEGLCPFNRSIPIESVAGFASIVGLVIIGIDMFTSAKSAEKLPLDIKTKGKEILKKLENDEKKVYDFILNSNGAVFQSELVEKAGLSKVKVTRVLDKLEARNLIERRRRGMSNLVVLKQ